MCVSFFAIYLGMGWRDDPNVLEGPTIPYWGCSKCGVDRNFASRIKCRCGATAATSIVQAAKRNAAAARLHPKATPKPKSKGGPPTLDKRDKELAQLRAENAKLRKDGTAQPAVDASMGDS